MNTDYDEVMKRLRELEREHFKTPCEPTRCSHTWATRNPENGRHHRNAHLIELRETSWRCLICGHWFDAAVDADMFACGGPCVGKHPGDTTVNPPGATIMTGAEVLAAFEALSEEWGLTEMPDERTAMLMRADLLRMIEAVKTTVTSPAEFEASLGEAKECQSPQTTTVITPGQPPGGEA